MMGQMPPGPGWVIQALSQPSYYVGRQAKPYVIPKPLQMHRPIDPLWPASCWRFSDCIGSNGLTKAVYTQWRPVLDVPFS